MEPIGLLQASLGRQGEGFSIVAIQCTLVEFLESTVQGINYKYKNPGSYEYSKSGDLFKSFLSTRAPFMHEFSEALAEDFYMNVRCPLLHEARTKNRWKIWGASSTGNILDVAEKKLFRDNFQAAIVTFVNDYKRLLLSSAAVQEAFVRKFEAICT